MTKSLFRPSSVLTSSPTELGVIDLVIDRLPVVADNVPLKDVLAFSRDPETKEQVTALRLWIAKSGKPGASLPDLALELDEMLHTFRRHMKVHRLRAKETAFRTIIAVPFAIVEDLLHGKPKSALDAVSWTSRRAARLEAELNAPGHELAFIESARKRFDG
jgi:hypothetical protein